jgi:general secretion pathway protein M
LPQKDVDDLVRIAVKVKLLGDMEMLRTILHEIEVEKPFMIIDEISIIPRRGRRNRKTRQIEETGKVTVTLEVSSYMRKKSANTN